MRISILVVCLAGSIARAADGRICVLAPVVPSGVTEAGAFQTGPGGTPPTVRVQLDRREKQEVSPTKAASFDALPLGPHVVAFFTADGSRRLQSVRVTMSEATSTLCLRREPTYGTWSVEPCVCKPPPPGG